MEASHSIALYLGIEGVWLPCLCKERNRHYFAETVDLKSAASECRHNRRIMDHVDLDSLLDASQVQVSMSCGAEGIANDEERHYFSLCFFDHSLTATLHELSVCHHDFLLEELRQALVRDHQDCRVHLQVYFGRCLNSFEALD